MSYADHVRAYEKSVVLGGARTLFPVPESLTHAFARQIQETVKVAEDMAYREGYATAQAEMRKALGIK